MVIGMKDWFNYGLLITLNHHLLTSRHMLENKNVSQSSNVLINPSTNSQDSLLILSTTNETIYHLETILEKSYDGKLFLQNHFDLNEKSRVLLNSIVINFFIQSGKRLTTKQADILSNEIVSKFKGEIKETWYAKRTGKTPKGMLYNRFQNQFKRLKTGGYKLTECISNVAEQDNGKYQHIKKLVPEKDKTSLENSLRSLRFDNLKPTEFDKLWKITQECRLSYIKNIPDTTNANLFVKWPEYKRPDGYRMVRKYKIFLNFYFKQQSCFYCTYAFYFP